MKTFAKLIVALVISGSAFGQDLTGQWNGMIHVQGMELRLVFHISKTDTAYTATLDSPDQGAQSIPVQMVQYENQLLSLDMPGIGAHYQGTYDKESEIFEGTFQQSGQTFPLNLSKKLIQKKVLLRPQEPSKPYPYYSEDVNFPSEQGTVELAGTLTLPQKKGNFPAAILISGSGPQNRDEEFMTHKPFLVLSDYLTRQGIAVLRYDDRGFGQSTGNHNAATSRDLANDVQAAINYLKTRNEIDATHIGLIGHSEGGLIAPMVASESDDVNFMVLLAGPGVSGDQILLQQVERMNRLAGKNEAATQREIQITKEAFALIKTTEDIDTLKQKLKTYFEKVADIEGVVPEEMSKEYFVKLNVKLLARPWTRYFLKYDPADALKKVQCPVLALNGDKDVQVVPENLKSIQSALSAGGNQQVTIKEYPEMNHLFQECSTGAMDEYATIEQTMAPVVLEEISTWILKQVK